VAIEYTDLFRAALKHIPRDLLTPEQWATLDYNPATSLQSLIELQNDRSMQISLPWPVGESRYLTQGPHGAQSAALDFAGPANATVHAARGGVAYHACPGAADTHLRIDHGNGISTNYYHLDAITVGNGQAVARWEAVGRQGTKVRCQGYVTGAHFHFWITINGQNMPIDGFEFGGWHVSGNCMIRIRDATTRCASIYFTANNTITNEGAIGSGYSIGQGSGREPVFDQAYNRHGGARNLGYPAGLVVWWGNTNPVMIQEYDGGAFGPSLLVYDRNNDPDHLRGVPAYVLRGAFRQHYQSIGGPVTNTSILKENPSKAFVTASSSTMGREILRHVAGRHRRMASGTYNFGITSMMCGISRWDQPGSRISPLAPVALAGWITPLVVNPVQCGGGSGPITSLCAGRDASTSMRECIGSAPLLMIGCTSGLMAT